MIIITGGAGFIGSNLLKALNNKNLKHFSSRGIRSLRKNE